MKEQVKQMETDKYKIDNRYLSRRDSDQYIYIRHKNKQEKKITI